MAERDPVERLTKMWDQQRKSVEEAVERLQEAGRRVAEGIVDAFKRAAPSDDVRGAIERLEAQFSRLSEFQRDAWERLVEGTRDANESLWNTIRSALGQGDSEAPAEKPPPAKKVTDVASTGGTGAAVAKKAPATGSAAQKAPPAKKSTSKKGPAKKPSGAKKASAKKPPPHMPSEPRPSAESAADTPHATSTPPDATAFPGAPSTGDRDLSQE